MAANDFTKRNASTGAPSQAVLDAGLNVFALDLLVESFTKLAENNTAPAEFTYKGVKVSLQISDQAK